MVTPVPVFTLPLGSQTAEVAVFKVLISKVVSIGSIFAGIPVMFRGTVFVYTSGKHGGACHSCRDDERGTIIHFSFHDVRSFVRRLTGSVLATPLTASRLEEVRIVGRHLPRLSRRGDGRAEQLVVWKFSAATRRTSTGVRVVDA
jgi:hypothetical protein